MSNSEGMSYKKHTKHTVVYEAQDQENVVPVESVYVSKEWLRRKGWNGREQDIPRIIRLEVTVVDADAALAELTKES